MAAEPGEQPVDAREAILHTKAVRSLLLDVLGPEEGLTRRLAHEMRLLLRGGGGRAAFARLVMGPHSREPLARYQTSQAWRVRLWTPTTAAVPRPGDRALVHQPERLQAGMHLGIPLHAVGSAKPRDVVLPLNPQRLPAMICPPRSSRRVFGIIPSSCRPTVA